MGTLTWIIVIGIIIYTRISNARRHNTSDEESPAEGRSIIDEIEEMLQQQGRRNPNEAWPTTHSAPRPRPAQSAPQHVLQPENRTASQPAPTPAQVTAPQTISQTHSATTSAQTPRTATTLTPPRQRQRRDDDIIDDILAINATMAVTGDSSTSDFIGNFDVRRAIIYSEIMRPIFKDED